MGRVAGDRRARARWRRPPGCAASTCWPGATWPTSRPAAPRCTPPRWQRRWAEAGIEVTVRTSYAQGHPPEGIRDGYRVIRKHGRFMVFPTTVLSEMLRRTGPVRRPGRDLERHALPEPAVGPAAPTSPLVHHVHKDMWRLVLEEKLAPYGEFLERRIAPPFYRRTPIVTLSESSRRELIDYLHFKPEQHQRRAARASTPASPPTGPRARRRWCVAVGRLMAPKRFDELIRIMAEVRDRHPDAAARHRGRRLRAARRSRSRSPTSTPTAGSASPATCPTRSSSPSTARPGSWPARRSPRAGA